MNGTSGTAATELRLMLPAIAGSMRQPKAITLACPDEYADAPDLTFALAGEFSSVRIARALASSLLRRWELAEIADDVTTVTSELVTNALRHGAPHTARDWVVLLRLIRKPDTLICAVADPSPVKPVLKEPDYVAETGRGLHVIQAYSREWGWTPRLLDQGKVVWAVF